MDRFYITMNIKGFSPTANRGGLVCGPIFVFSRDDFPLVADPPPSARLTAEPRFQRGVLAEIIA